MSQKREKLKMAEWREVKLGDIAFINPNEHLEKGGKAKKVNMEDLQPFTKKINNGSAAEYKGGSKFRNGDTLIARITPCLENGKTGYVDILEENEVAFGSTEFIVLREKEAYSDKQFLFYFSVSSRFRNIAIQSMIGSSGRQRVQANIIKNYEFMLPPLEEQREIARVLSVLDDKIDLLRRQNETLESIAQTLFKEYFITNANPNWEKGKLEDLLESIESGSRPKGGIDPLLKNGIPSIGAESIKGIGNFDYGGIKYITENFFDNMKRGIARSFDVLIYKDGAYIGRKGLFGNGFPFKNYAVNEHVFILRANKKATQLFLYFLLEEAELRTLNSNSAQPGLNQVSMKSFSITKPPQDRIYEFDAIAKPLINRIFENSKQARLLAKTRDRLLPRLISGKLRVGG
jgi:type I restriction enzyme S subunit